MLTRFFGARVLRFSPGVHAGRLRRSWWGSWWPDIFRRLLGHERDKAAVRLRDLARAAPGVVHRDAPADLLAGSYPGRREMRRSRVSGGAILAFAMTAPLFNPLSMLYGLTLSAAVRHPVVRVLHDGRGHGRGRRSGTSFSRVSKRKSPLPLRSRTA